MKAGQALIIVLLALGVALTVGLAIVARSVTEVSVSSVQDESARALSAAEAGIEQSLGGVITGSSGSGSVGTVGDVFTVQRSSAGGITNYVIQEELIAGDTTTVVLDDSFNSSSTNNLRICWGVGGSQTAVEIMAYYRPVAGGEAIVNTLAYDSIARVPSNGFITTGVVGGDPGCPTGVNGYGYLLGNTQNLIAPGYRPLYLRVRTLYNGSSPQPVGFVAGGWGFPAQGDEIVSVGQAGGTTQKISVFRGTPDWLPMWDDAVFSGSSLIQ